MAPFDSSCTYFYWSAIVTIALSGTVFELFDAEYYCDLEIRVEVTQDHFTGTIWNLGCGFLYTFRSNYGRIFNHDAIR